jgi:hypothetical protein
VEGTNGCNTSKAKLSFNLLGEKNDSTQGKWADLNPFEALNGENESSNFLTKNLRRAKGRMDIPRGKKNKVRIDTIRSEGDRSPHLIARASIAPKGKRGQMYSEFHQSFFTSLGIPLPANADLCRARV